MKILIISFSDIHLTNNDDYILSRSEKIFDAVKNVEPELKKIILLISGDISFSGKNEEFFNALCFFEKITEKLKEYCKCEVEVIPSPGNHDCDFREDEKNLRKISVEDVYKNEDLNLDSHLLEFLCSPLNDFFDFRNSLGSHKHLKYDHRIVYQYDLQLDSDINVKVNCFNTAWLSQIKEQQGKLYFPITYLPQESDFSRSNLTISLLHHPYNWYNETNARKFRDFLEKNSDIIITGHEHIKDQYTGEINSFRKGMGISNMSSSSLASIPIPIPPLEEQAIIVEKLNQFMLMCDELEKKIEKRDYYQDRIMQAVVKQAFTVKNETINI